MSIESPKHKSAHLYLGIICQENNYVYLWWTIFLSVGTVGGWEYVIDIFSYV